MSEPLVILLSTKVFNLTSTERQSQPWITRQKYFRSSLAKSSLMLIVLITPKSESATVLYMRQTTTPAVFMAFLKDIAPFQGVHSQSQ